MTDSVENWGSIIHKTITAKDGHLIGSVNAVDDRSVLISNEDVHNLSAISTGLAYFISIMIEIHKTFRIGD